MRLTVILIPLLLVLGCGNRATTTADLNVPVEVPQETPVLIASTVPVALPEYRIGFGDVIEVRFFNKSQFNDEIKVRPDGRISMEKIGELVALGLTPLQLDSLITAGFSRIIEDPEVTVIIKEYSNQNVYILGEVNQPGGYPIEPNMTILRAITMAGGYTTGAKLNSVILIRLENYTRPVATRLDLTPIIAEQNLDKDILIKPNDIVFIPKTFIAELNTFVDRFFTRLVYTPLDMYLRGLLYSRAWRE